MHPSPSLFSSLPNMLARLTSNPTSKTGKWNTNMDHERKELEQEKEEDLITVSVCTA